MSMVRFPAATLGLALCLACFAMVDAGGANERREWFRGLKQPGTGASCCDIADCRRTEAYWADGQWWAQVWGRWSPIPPDKLIRDRKSYDGQAYVCASWSAGVLCFVPPNLAM